MWMPYAVMCQPLLHKSNILPKFCTDTWPYLEAQDDVSAPSTATHVVNFVAVAMFVSVVVNTLKTADVVLICSFGLV